MVISKLMALATGVVNAVLNEPRAFSSPVPSHNFGSTDPGFCLGKSIVAQETCYGSGRWQVEVRKHNKSGDSYDGDLDGFKKPLTTAQVLAGLDRVFTQENMSESFIRKYKDGMRKSMEAIMPQPEETLTLNQL